MGLHARRWLRIPSLNIYIFPILPSATHTPLSTTVKRMYPTMTKLYQREIPEAPQSAVVLQYSLDTVAKLGADFRLQFLLIPPLQWECRLGWHQRNLSFKLSLSPHKTRSSVSLYGNHYLQLSARPCRSFSPTYDILQGLNSHIQLFCLRTPWVPMSPVLTSPLSPWS